MTDLSAIHSETQEFPFRKGIFALSFAAFAAIPVFLKLPWWMTAGILLIGFLSAALVTSVLILHVRLTTFTLEFGYWFSSPTIDLKDVRDPKIVDIPKLAGIGMHYYRGEWVYNARFGRGIRFSTPKRKYLVGSNNPEQLLSALLGALPRAA